MNAKEGARIKSTSSYLEDKGPKLPSFIEKQRIVIIDFLLFATVNAVLKPVILAIAGVLR